MQLSDQKIGVIAGIISAFAFAIMALSVQKVSTIVPIQEISFVRGFISFLALLPIAYKNIPSLFSMSAKFVWFRSMAGASSVICYFWNTSIGSAAEAKALSNVAPFFVAIFSYIFYKEKLNRRELVGLLILLSGAFLLIFHIQASQGNFVYLIGMLGAFFAGIAYLSLKQASHHYQKTLIVLVFSMCVMMVSFLTPSKAWIIPQGNDLFWLLIVGISGMVGQLTLTLSHLKLKNAIASSLTLLTLIFLILYESAQLGHLPAEQTLLSYLGITLGMILMISAKKAKSSP